LPFQALHAWQAQGFFIEGFIAGMSSVLGTRLHETRDV